MKTSRNPEISADRKAPSSDGLSRLFDVLEPWCLGIEELTVEELLRHKVAVKETMLPSRAAPLDRADRLIVASARALLVLFDAELEDRGYDGGTVH